MCYDKVYNNNDNSSSETLDPRGEPQQRQRRQPLEWGEIDIERAQEFSDCVDAEIKENRRLERLAKAETKLEKNRSKQRE
jgi:hypothetical protein